MEVLGSNPGPESNFPLEFRFEKYEKVCQLENYILCKFSNVLYLLGWQICRCVAGAESGDTADIIIIIIIIKYAAY